MTAQPAQLDVPGSERATVTVVLPCLNEAGSVGSCVRESLDAIERAGYGGEVVVVDNNSTDDSSTRARAAGARVIAEAMPGYGAALRAGFIAAHGDVIVMADADGTYPLSRLAELVEPVMRGHADLAIGARLDSADRRTMPFLHRYVGTPALTTLAQLAGAQHGLTDSQSGFRAFRRRDTQELALHSTGMELASEMIIRAGQCGLTIKEIPLGYRERTGESKLRTWADGLRHLRLIMTLGPHVALWYPGLTLLAVSIALLVASLFFPNGLVVGDVLWQPVFAASILSVVGLCAATAGALLAAFDSSTSPHVSTRFRWVHDRRTPRVLKSSALMIVLGGLAIDGLLFVRWAVDAPVLRAQLQIATAAQVAVVSGSMLLMVAALLSLVLGRVLPR
jgi:glycosyltransferase involved in cell wall biosynthesis